MKRGLWALLAILAGMLAAREASGHIVPVGVGTQTWIEVRPRRVVVRFNLGFASLRGVDELKLADSNKDRRVTADEEQAYLDALIKRVIPKLSFHLDGKPLEMRAVRGQAAGLRGEIATVAFDTFFDLEADVSVGPGSHELVYYEGTFQGEISQQILHVVTDHATDFESFDVEQKTQGPSPVEEAGALTLQGRDVSMRFAFLPKALERDRAEALIEPCVAGLQGTLDQLATNVARSSERDLAGLPIGSIRLGLEQQSFITTGGSGFNVSAPTASNRDNSSALTSLRNEEMKEADEMTKKLAEPMTLLTVFVFLLWGASHATGPGHGKGMVAAYLLGTKGRLWDAVRLGLIVTFTHTFTLYTFGLGLVLICDQLRLTSASKDSIMQRSIFLISLMSGIGLFCFGLVLAWRRKQALAKGAGHDHGHDHAHGHDHDHGHGHGHDHAPAPLPEKLEAPRTGRKLGLVMAAPVEVPAPVAHSHDGHSHSHDGHSHSHGGHSHSHEGMSEDAHAAAHAREAATEISSFKDLLVLGMQGGIIPCPAGIALILGSIGFEQTALKTFIYLNAFSLGLGAVLVGIASFMVFSRRFLEQALTAKRKRVLDVLPVVSAVLVSFVGLAIVYEAFDPNYTKARARLFGSVSSADKKTK